MNNFINDLLPELDSGRMAAFMGLLEKYKSTGLVRTRQELDKELQRLMDTFGLKGWKRSFNAKLPSIDDPTIKSADFNENFEGIYIDLSALYRHIASLGATVRSHDGILTSEVMKIKDLSKKFQEDAAIYKFKKANPEYNEVKYNTFISNTNLSGKPSKAFVDTKIDQLVLPAVGGEIVTDKRGKNGTKIEVTCLSNDPSIGACKAFRPENAIDSIRDTFWAEVIMCDGEVATKYNNTAYNGVVVEALITFAHVEQFNTVEILPFGRFPVRIIDIETSTDGISYTQWPGYETLFGSLDWLVYRNAPTAARYVKIVMLQENYIPVNYLIPKDLVDNVKAWEHVMDTEFNYLEEIAVLYPKDERARLVDKGYNAMIDAQRSLDMIDPQSGIHNDMIPNMPHRQHVSDIISVMSFAYKDKKLSAFSEQLPGRKSTTTRPANVIEISKHEYLLGAYSIKLSNNIYTNHGEYKSQMYASRGQPITIALTTDEVHEYGKDRDRNDICTTSVAYSLELDNNKTLPILPAGTSRVISEFMSLDPSTNSGLTRFYPSFTNFAKTVSEEDLFVLTWGAASAANETVYLDDKLLVRGTDYTFAWDGKLTMIGFEMETHKSNQVIVSYDVGNYSGTAWISDIHTMRKRVALPRIVRDGCLLYIDDIYDVSSLPGPLEYKETNDKGSIELPMCPYVLRQIVNSEDLRNPDWLRKDKRDAVWYPRRESTPMYIESMWYGQATGYLMSAVETADGIRLLVASSPELTAAVDPTTLRFPSDSDPEYQIRLGSSIAKAVTEVDGVNVYILVTAFGIEGTSEYSVADLNNHLVGRPVELHALPSYEPIRITIDGVRAKNLTDYKTHEQPAFARVPENASDYEFIHIGKKLYFSRPIQNADIKVTFLYLTAYVQLVAELRNTPLGNGRVTPAVNAYRLAMQTVRL